MITFQDNQAVTISNKDAHNIKVDIPFERN